METWIYFIHPPREDFAATMTEAETECWGRHWARLQAAFAEGRIVLVGPTLGRTNTGLCIFEAADEPTARVFMEEDPVIAEGFARGELRPMRVSLLRGREPTGAPDAPAAPDPRDAHDEPDAAVV